MPMSSLCAEWLNFIESCNTTGTYEHLWCKRKLAQHIEVNNLNNVVLVSFTDGCEVLFYLRIRQHPECLRCIITNYTNFDF